MRIMTTAERTAREDKARKTLVKDFVKTYGRKPHFPERIDIEQRVRKAASNRSEEDSDALAIKQKEWAKLFATKLPVK